MTTQPSATDVVSLTGWQDVRDGYRRRELRQALYDGGKAVMHDCLLNLHGPEHQARRRVEARLFRRETFEFWEFEVLGDTIDATLAPASVQGRTDLVELGYRLAMNLTATVAGLDVDPTDRSEADALHAIVSTLSEGATMAHSTRPVAELTAEIEQAIDRLDAYFLAPAAARRATEPGSDVLSTLLTNQSELGLSSESIRREVGFYLQAGAHSTAHGLVHAFDELFRWVGDKMTPADLADDSALLQRVFYESLRLHPASPVALRRATSDFVLGNGTSVGDGQLVEFDLISANRDPKVFGADAGQFNPNRDIPQGVPRWGNSFGGGMHACLGQILDGGLPLPEGTTSSGTRSDSEAQPPLLGTVAVMLQRLLRLGFMPDPSSPPTRLATSTRSHYATYPIRKADDD